MPKSNRIAAGTIGTTPRPNENPTSRSARNRITPDAASNPNALPPPITTPCTCSTRFPGRSRSVSRVPGAPPRTSTPATHGRAGSTTVHPVIARLSVQCPTRIPGTSVIDPASTGARLPGARSLRPRCVVTPSPADAARPSRPRRLVPFIRVFDSRATARGVYVRTNPRAPPILDQRNSPFNATAALDTIASAQHAPPTLTRGAHDSLCPATQNGPRSSVRRVSPTPSAVRSSRSSRRRSSSPPRPAVAIPRATFACASPSRRPKKATCPPTTSSARSIAPSEAAKAASCPRSPTRATAPPVRPSSSTSPPTTGTAPSPRCATSSPRRRQPRRVRLRRLELREPRRHHRHPKR